MDGFTYDAEWDMGIAENIDALLVMYDISQARLAEIAGADPSSVNHWRKGSKPRDESIERICEHFGLTRDDLLSDSYGLAAKRHGRFGKPVTAGERAMIPLVTLGRVHAGPLSEEEAVMGQTEVPASVLENHPRARALIVEGDCMDRFVLPGMAVVVDPDLTPANGSVVVVETEIHDAVIRRWFRGTDSLMLVADSHEEYPDIVLRFDDGPISVLGVVVWVQSARELV